MPSRPKKATINFPGTRIPFCPDPENHVLVKGKHRPYWRKKREVEPYNRALAENAELSKIVSRVASTVLQKLAPYTLSLSMGNVHLRLAHGFRRAVKERGGLDYQSLVDFDFQPDRLMSRSGPSIDTVQTRDTLDVLVKVLPGRVKYGSNRITHFFYELILLYGDPADSSSLRIETAASVLYPYKDTPSEKCVLSMVLPEGKPWMALVKLHCVEATRWDNGFYAMKVVAAG